MPRRPRLSAAFAAFVLLVAAACGGGGAARPEALVIPTASGATSIAPPDDSGDLELASPLAWSDSDAGVPVSSADPSIGARDALVTIVVFSDFQCPFCARVEPTLAKIREHYGSTDLRIVWKNRPLDFHPNARPAAEAARGVFELAGSDAFWAFHDKAFANQADLTHDNFVQWAADAGVRDLGAFADGLDAHRWGAKIDEDVALAVKVGANGTPHSYVNGVELSGAQPFDKFKEVIDLAMADANAKIAAGTPRGRVYAVTSKENFKPPAPRGATNAAAQADTTTVWKLPVGKQPARGGAAALVTIVEFGDYQCQYCRKVEATMTALRAKYGADLRIVWFDEPLPFHPRALPAAELAREARAEKGDAAFWAVHDDLFANGGALDDASLDDIARRAGLDLGKVHAAMRGERYKAQIDADGEVAEDFLASGTPHFFIDGRRLVGAQAQEDFEAIIDDELTKARALVRQGTPASKVYDELTKAGQTPPPFEKKSVALPARPIARGAATAKVTIQEFADFQCPYCARAEATLTEILKRYGGKVRLVWRDLPLPMHTSAPLAAEAAREALAQKGAAGFWQMHDSMFGNQTDLSRATLDGYATQLGLDMTRWGAALDASSHKGEIDKDASAASAAGIVGTPSFLINGYFVNGAQPYAKFRRVIELALKEAK